MLNELKTGYEWSVESNIRFLNFDEWHCVGGVENSYFEEKITKEDFLNRALLCSIKPNSTPRKTQMYLKYRMYGMVPYQLKGIQGGIQFGHAVVALQRLLENNYDILCDDGYAMISLYNKWADNDKTFIVLDGGTTNNSSDSTFGRGTLNKAYYQLIANNIIVAPFFEPDLGDQMTAIAFLVDERVYDKETYPDFVPTTLPWSRKMPNQKALDDLADKNAKNLEAYKEKIGGESNYFLRNYLRSFKLFNG